LAHIIAPDAAAAPHYADNLAVQPALREVGEGRSFILTNRGIAVGRIVPLDAPAPTLPIARPAKRAGGWAALKPQQSEGDRPMARILDELREDRV